MPLKEPSVPLARNAESTILVTVGWVLDASAHSGRDSGLSGSSFHITARRDLMRVSPPRHSRPPAEPSIRQRGWTGSYHAFWLHRAGHVTRTSSGLAGRAGQDQAPPETLIERFDDDLRQSESETSIESTGEPAVLQSIKAGDPGIESIAEVADSDVIDQSDEPAAQQMLAGADNDQAVTDHSAWSDCSFPDSSSPCTRGIGSARARGFNPGFLPQRVRPRHASHRGCFTPHHGRARGKFVGSLS